MAAIVVVGLVAGRAAADVISVSGDRRSTNVESITRELPLDAHGWVLEARLEVLDDTATATVHVQDDRIVSGFTWNLTAVTFDGESFQLPSRAGVHTFRIEAQDARRILLVDGKVVIDHDAELPLLVLDKPRGVTMRTEDASPVHWISVQVDTAPTQLARSGQPFVGAIHFAGPFAPWLHHYAQRETSRAADLAALQLPEAARACVAFAIVAAFVTPHPAHLRLGELAKLPKGARPGTERMIPEPTFEFRDDLLEAPAMRRAARRPAMRRRGTPPEISAQAQLRLALTAKDPRPFYDQAVAYVLDGAAVTREAQDWLVPQLEALALHPAACR